MTYEEVKNLYNSNEFQETVCHSKLCNYANTGCSDCEITHMNILSNEALEKQIPKMPDIEGDGYWNGELVYDTWICPCCGEHYEIEFEKYNYCPECGQRIDLSEV